MLSLILMCVGENHMHMEGYFSLYKWGPLKATVPIQKSIFPPVQVEKFPVARRNLLARDHLTSIPMAKKIWAFLINRLV